MIQSITFISPKQDLFLFTIEQELKDCEEYLCTIEEGSELYKFVTQYRDNLQAEYQRIFSEYAKQKDFKKAMNTWDDWHILPVERPVFSPPSPKTHYIDVPGGNGSLDLTETLAGYPTYENRIGSFTFRVMNDYGKWADRYSEIMGYLHGQSMYAVLVDDFSWFYKGRFSVDDWKSGDTWSEITIGYNVNPFKWGLYSSTNQWLWNPFNFNTDMIYTGTFKDIQIDSPSSETELSFLSDFFGSVPVAPTITIFPPEGEDETTYTGMQVRFVNTYLNINLSLHLEKGSTFVPDFIFYGQVEPYKMYFQGHGTVSIDFRVGRL